MDIDKLILLCDIAETNNLTLSAERMGYTQSGVSHSIKKIEEEMGIKLFKRMKNGVQLTHEGLAVMPYISSIVKYYGMMNNTIDALGGVQTGSIEIGAYSSVASIWLPVIIREFKTMHPNVSIRIREGHMSEIERWINEKSIDFGFLSWRKEQNFKFVVLARDPLYAVVPKHFPLPPDYSDSFPISAFTKYPVISYEPDMDHDDISHILKKSNISIKRSFTCHDDYTIIRMIENDLGIGLLPGMILENHDGNVRKIPLSPPKIRTLGIGILSENTLSRAADSFMKISKKTVAKMQRQSKI